MAVTVKDIEDAIITAVQTDMTYARKVATYKGELDEAQIMQFALNTPAVLIALESNEMTSRSWPLMWQHPRFTILVADRNLRSNEAARRGDGSDGHPGTYQMLEDLFSALFQQTLGLDIDPFDIVLEDAVINNSQISVYAATYRTKTAKN